MGAMDAMVAKLQGEIEERESFINTLSAQATEAGRDLSDQEIEMIGAANERIDTVKKSLAPLRQAQLSTIESRNKTAALDAELAQYRRQNPGGTGGRPIEYRSAGEYIADLYWAKMGDRESADRLEAFDTENRAAAHQTTADNAGLLPEQIVAPVVNFVDNARPLVAAIGTTDLGPGSWAYAKVTQHTQVGAQSAEKAELASRKMTITKTSITAPTYGGYVNVSKQDIRRTSPAIMDMIITDLASEYAIQTEAAAGTDLLAAATAGTALDGTPTADEIAASLWDAAATAYTNVRGGGRLILAVAPGDLGKFGRLFAPVNPTNSQSSGFAAGSFGSGAIGAISGISVVMTPGLATGQALVINTAGVRLFEYRYGNMTVDEPSVWGVQVGYAGDFETVVVQTGAVVSIDTVP